MAKTKTAKHKTVPLSWKGGSHPIPVDWLQINELARLHGTMEEIASCMRIDYDTLNKASKREHGVPITEYVKSQGGEGKMSLRRAQFVSATQKFNPTMLVWLGKQLLDQVDKPDGLNVEEVASVVRVVNAVKKFDAE